MCNTSGASKLGDWMQRAARGFLIVVSILNGVAGLVCGVLFIAGPDGHFLQAGALLDVVQELPLASLFFQDFVWIGVAMLLVLGLPNSVATVMLLRKKRTSTSPRSSPVFSFCSGRASSSSS